jgi:subtilase family serine protease
MRSLWHIPLLVLFITLVLPAQVSALYNFEGIPLQVVSQGEVNGVLMVNGTLGLREPPVSLEYELPGPVIWGRVYAGIWGGTERYTGWVNGSVNGVALEKIILYGTDDRSPQVSVSGHGIYLVGYNATALLHQGANRITIQTSRSDPSAKIDGRVYAVMAVAAVQSPSGTITRYWVAEGNENLHGEGWSGTNPTSHDTASVTFNGGIPADPTRANLTFLMVASTRGQPDYVQFNGADLGTPPPASSGLPPGARDIGDEISGDACGGKGQESRYVDLETCDVLKLLQPRNNAVTFERGRDLNRDGEITTTGESPEGEDYIHPSLAILTVQRNGGTPSLPDMAVTSVKAAGAYIGEDTTLVASLVNHGTVPSAPVTVIFSVDGNPVATQNVSVDPAGIQTVSATWRATGGEHVVVAEVAVAGDLHPEDNRASTTVRVGSPQDLVVEVEAPYRSGSGDANTSPPGLLVAPLGLAVALLIFRRRSKPVLSSLALILLVGIVGTPLLIAVGGALESTTMYLLPVIVANQGGSDAPSFALAVYLDGERVAARNVSEGIPAGKDDRMLIPVYTSPGQHRVRVVADEEGTIRDADRSSNIFEQVLAFP